MSSGVFKGEPVGEKTRSREHWKTASGDIDSGRVDFDQVKTPQRRNRKNEVLCAVTFQWENSNRSLERRPNNGRRRLKDRRRGMAIDQQVGDILIFPLENLVIKTGISEGEFQVVRFPRTSNCRLYKNDGTSLEIDSSDYSDTHFLLAP